MGFHQTNLMNGNTSYFSLFDSTNLIKLIWLCISDDSWLVDWFKSFSVVDDWFNLLHYLLFLKYLYLILLNVKSFVRTCIRANLLYFLHHSQLFFFQKQYFNWLQLDSNPEPLSSEMNTQPLVSLVKWLSVHLRNKWFCVLVQLQSLNLQISCRARSSLTCRQM